MNAATVEQTLESSLLREVKHLELVARRNVSSLLTGNYRTTIIGRGMDFHESRKYLPGDDFRSLDWKTTARLDAPHVKTFVEERQREIVIALDVSHSMHSGWSRLTKIEAAVELAATLAVSAMEAGDRLGWVTFAERTHEVSPPRPGKKHLFRALKTFVSAAVDPAPESAFSDPRAAFHAIQGFKGDRQVVFVISDFIDQDVPRDLAYIGRRHDVSLLHVHDPLVHDFGPFRRTVLTPEGAGSAQVLSHRQSRRLENILATLKEEAARARISMESFSTADPLGPALARFFRRRRVEGAR